MALIKLTELDRFDVPEEQEHKVVHPLSSNSSPISVAPVNSTLSQLFPDVVLQRTCMAISEGQWSLHDMVQHFVGLLGPSECILSSWGISTRPMQCISQLVHDKVITSFRAVFDHRVRLQCPEAFQLLLGLRALPHVELLLTKIHAKMVVLQGANASVCIHTSANLTQNPRIESYIVSTDTGLVQGTADRMASIIARANQFTE